MTTRADFGVADVLRRLDRLRAPPPSSPPHGHHDTELWASPRSADPPPGVLPRQTHHQIRRRLRRRPRPVGGAGPPAGHQLRYPQQSRRPDQETPATDPTEANSASSRDV